jgi:uncharacterized damage-inducible protein DinB
MAAAELAQLLANLDRAYDHASWHGTSLRGAVRGVGLDVLTFRPGRGRHNVWELALHCAYWKYALLRRLTGAKRGSFPLAGSNFFPRPEPGVRPTAAAWKRDLALLDAMHAKLRAAVAALDARALDRRLAGGRWTLRETILGIAAHDLYHAGQIQLLKRLARSRGR